MPQSYQRTNSNDESQFVSKQIKKWSVDLWIKILISVQRNDSSTSRSRRVDSKLPNRRPLITYTSPAKQECGDTYCTADPNYPLDVIASLNTELQKYEYLFGDDFVDTIELRFDSDESGLCQSRRRLIHPKRGQTRQNTWLTIINDDKYRQGITVEECQWVLHGLNFIL